MRRCGAAITPAAFSFSFHIPPPILCLDVSPRAIAPLAMSKAANQRKSCRANPTTRQTGTQLAFLWVIEVNQKGEWKPSSLIDQCATREMARWRLRSARLRWPHITKMRIRKYVRED